MHPHTSRQRPPRAVVYSEYPATHACAHIRILSPLLASGFEIIWNPRLESPAPSIDTDIAKSADIIIIQRQFPSYRTEAALSRLLNLRIPVVYDLDDMLLAPPATHPSFAELSRRGTYIKWMLDTVDLVIVSTPELKESLQTFTTNRRICDIPNLVDWAIFHSPPRTQEYKFNFLISGTSTHSEDWAIIEPPLAQMLDSFSGRVNAIFFGQPPTALSNHPFVRSIDFEGIYTKYAQILKTLEIHAALTPLADTEFNKCKSDIKWLEYSAAGIPGAFSDIEPYRSSIASENTGLLVPNTHESWLQAMKKLVEEPALASSIAQRAQKQVFELHSIDHQATNFAAPYFNLLDTPRRSRRLSGLATFGQRLQVRLWRSLNNSQFLSKHFLWRFTDRRSHSVDQQK